MRDPLDEPRTTPAPRGTCRICDKTIALLRTGIVRAHRARGRTGPWCLGAGEFPADTPPTLRDLIEAARAAGAPPRFQLGGDGWGQWVGESDDEQWRVVAEHKHGDWTVWMHGPGGAAKVNQATEDRIAAAARLCGWELGSTT